MTFSLSPPLELETEINKRLASGRYASIDEIICEALQLLFRYERITDDCLKLLEQETDAGTDRFEGWESTESRENAPAAVRTAGADVRAAGVGKLKRTP